MALEPTAPQIRQALDDLCWQGRNQGGQLTTEQQSQLVAFAQSRQQLRPSLPADYWPIIDDRLALCESFVFNAHLTDNTPKTEEKI